MTALLPTTFYFRFSAAVGYCDELPAGAPGPSARPAAKSSEFRLLGLTEEHALPSLGALDGRPEFGQLRLAWNERGLGIALEVLGKRQPPQVDPHRPELSDGLHVWIDTRDARTIHRATRFCQRFYFLPAIGRPSARTGGVGEWSLAPAGQVRINRAREDAPLCGRDDLLAVVRPLAKGAASAGNRGYLLEAFLPAACLTGFDPQENPRLGFCYHVHDAELGDQFLTVGREFPFAEDPSLWSTLELTR